MLLALSCVCLLTPGSDERIEATESTFAKDTGNTVRRSRKHNHHVVENGDGLGVRAVHIKKSFGAHGEDPTKANEETDAATERNLLVR